jgi:hypothetical protein
LPSLILLNEKTPLSSHIIAFTSEESFDFNSKTFAWAKGLLTESTTTPLIVWEYAREDTKRIMATEKSAVRNFGSMVVSLIWGHIAVLETSPTYYRKNSKIGNLYRVLYSKYPLK